MPLMIVRVELFEIQSLQYTVKNDNAQQNGKFHIQLGEVKCL